MCGGAVLGEGGWRLRACAGCGRAGAATCASAGWDAAGKVLGEAGGLRRFAVFAVSTLMLCWPWACRFPHIRFVNYRWVMACHDSKALISEGERTQREGGEALWLEGSVKGVR